MPTLDIFSNDAFSLAAMTAAINEQAYVPGRLGELGLFEEEGITTTTVQIEKQGETLALVSSGVRGAAGQVVTGDKRTLLPFNAIHLPQRAAILADTIQNLRAFGAETEVQAVQTVVNQRLAKMRRQLDATIEYHRIGAVKGQILDADGLTVLLDLYSAFGISQATVSFALATSTTEIRSKVGEVLDAIESALGAAPFTGVRVLCGKTFWSQLIVHPKVKETYLNTQMAASLRGDPREVLNFSGVTFERYRGSVGGVAFIADAEAYALPEGVPELFITRYAPADYMETVNSTGLPYYAKQEPMPFGKGVDLEAQSNPLNLCTRPAAVIKLTAA